MASVSPFPVGLSRARVMVFAPGTDVRRVAGMVCERAWRGQGVRVWRWPCGSVAVADVGSRADGQLLTQCIDALLATYAQHGVFGYGVVGAGPQLVEVLQDLNWARAACA